MIVECSGCKTIFPVDPKKVPTAGIHARCSVCGEVFFVIVPEPEEESAAVAAPPPPAEGVVVEAEAEPEAVYEVVEEESPEEEFGTIETTPIEAPDVGVDEAPAAPEEATPVLEGVEETLEDVDEVVEEGVVGEADPVVDEIDAAVGEADPVVDEIDAAVDEADVVVEEVDAAAEEAGVIEGEMEEAVEDVGTVTEAPSATAPLFGKRDPKEKAQRLARVLVSDIILYNPDRHHSATESGRVKEEFEEEIQKSWNEYVEQVGEEIANTTSFFNDALNEILAKGEQIF